MMKIGREGEIVSDGERSKGVRRRLLYQSSDPLFDGSLSHREEPIPLEHPGFAHPPLTRETGCPRG